MHISTFLISLLLVACVSAASFQPLAPAASIRRRQVAIAAPSPLPSQCTTTCGPVTSEVSLGCPTTACCTTTFETQYYNCLECVGMALNVANYSSAQNSLNLLYTTCVDIGFVLPRLELPGQTASNASSGAAMGASATALFPTGSSGAAPSSAATGAAVGVRWCDGQAAALTGAVVLLGLVGLW